MIMRKPVWPARAVLIACALLFAGPAALFAQSNDNVPAISQAADAEQDAAIARRINGIFAEVSGLSGIDVEVREGVVVLEGEVASEAAVSQAVAIAGRVEGVVLVDDRLDRTLDIETNVSPFIADVEAGLTRLSRSWPVYLIVAVVFVLIVWSGFRLSAWSGFWNRVAPNRFLAEMMAQAFRMVAIAIAVLVSFALLGATAMLGALAGALGIIGLALGFAVRDTIENYIASILLSIRQPFRAGEHVIINTHEGVVARLTSRATVLMTLDGNHLRIPNADVFKGIILNYTRNPERRFSFDLGVDAEDDPVDAMDTGLKALSGLDFVLAEPEADAAIVEVGDSSIVVRFTGWVDQTQADFLKALSLAIRAVKSVLEAQGFTLPEPIYRLRFDQGADLPQRVAPSSRTQGPQKAARQPGPVQTTASTDVTPDRHLERKVAEERSETAGEDLLSDASPVE